MGVLAAIGTVLAGLIIFAMYPGGISPDGVFQVRQIRGEVPYNDWQPVSMTWTWHQLTKVFGTVTALLWAQVFFGWVCALLTSYVLLKISRRTWVAALGLFMLFMPNMVNILGVFYKDVQLALALYLAVLMMFLVLLQPKGRWVWAAVAFGSLVYAALVRKNSAVAVLPIVAVFVLWFLRARVSRVRGELAKVGVISIIATGVVGGTVLAADKALASATGATQNSQFTQVFIDDIVFGMPEEAIRSADAPQAEKDRIMFARETCKKREEQEGREFIWDAYWNCYGLGVNGAYTEVEDPDAVVALWKATVPHHLGDYAKYRAKTTWRFLTSTSSVASSAVRGDQVDLPPTHPKARDIHSGYVYAAAYGYMPFMFLGITAFTACIAGVVVSLRTRTRSLGACAVFTSIILYVLTYFPTAPADLYRYSYWPFAGAMFGWLLIAASRRHTRRLRAEKKNRVAKQSRTEKDIQPVAHDSAADSY